MNGVVDDLTGFVGEVVAARPNLNRCGAVTLHRVGPKGGVHYHAALARGGVGVSVLIDRPVVHRHLSVAELIGRTGHYRVPCVSLVGRLVAVGETADQRVRDDLEAFEPLLLDPRDERCWVGHDIVLARPDGSQPGDLRFAYLHRTNLLGR